MKSFFSAMIAICICSACNTTKNAASSSSNFSALEGTWQLTYITGPRIAFDGLYPDNKPTITIDIKRKKVIGNTSCNSFSGKITIDGKKISFSEPVATKLSCRGEGESIFLKTLTEVNGYDVTAGYTLSLFMGNAAMMRFAKVRGQ